MNGQNGNAKQIEEDANEVTAAFATKLYDKKSVSSIKDYLMESWEKCMEALGEVKEMQMTTQYFWCGPKEKSASKAFLWHFQA